MRIKRLIASWLVVRPDEFRVLNVVVHPDGRVTDKIQYASRNARRRMRRLRAIYRNPLGRRAIKWLTRDVQIDRASVIASLRKPRLDGVSDRYILVGHEPVEEPDLMTWARWFEDADRQVRDSIQGDVRVSTVFLGLDHGFGGRVELFETMVFIGQHGNDGERYATWNEAEEGHARWVAKVFKPTPILTLPTDRD